MLLTKTDKARDELQPGRRTLTQRERALLLLADGRQSVTDFAPLFGGREEAGRIADQLLQRGYLQAPLAPPKPAQRLAPPPPARAPATPLAPIAPGSPPRAVPGPSRSSTPAPTPTPISAPAPAPVAADTFDGNRSLATTRMFLFDLCERMFVRRVPERAAQFRDALRDARDRASMLAVGEEMLADIARDAGPERAASIRERIEKLLPALA